MRCKKIDHTYFQFQPLPVTASLPISLTTCAHCATPRTWSSAKPEKVAHGLYHLEVTFSSSATAGQHAEASANVAQKDSSLPAAALQLWHNRLGHLNDTAVQHLFSHRMFADIEEQLRHVRKLGHGNTSQRSAPCEACTLGKSHRRPTSTAASTRASAPLELVHTDVCGPFRVQGSSGALYFMTVVDDFSRLIWIRFMPDKKEVFSLFRAYKTWAENALSAAGHRIKRVRMDGGGEYASTVFTRWLDQQGVEIERTTPYTPSQNGVAERVNRTLANLTRSMMIAAQLPHKYWVEAAQAAVYIRNRSPTSAVPGMTPYEAFHGTQPTLERLRAYGCLAYAHIPEERQQGKLAPRATECMLIGYSTQSPAYLLLDIQRDVVIRSQDVVFEESCIGLRAIAARGGKSASTAPLPYVPIPLPLVAEGGHESPATHSEAAGAPAGSIVGPPPSELEDEDELPDELPALLAPPADLVAPPLAATSPTESKVDEVIPPVTQPASADVLPEAAPTSSRPRAKKLLTALRKLQDTLTSGSKYHAPSTVPKADAMVATESRGPAVTDPMTVREALQRPAPECDEWRDEIGCELDSMIKADVWKLVELPKGKRAIGSTFVFRTKFDAQGRMIRRKVRLVAQGFTQQYGVDYLETYAPVARFASIRGILAMTAHHDWELARGRSHSIAVVRLTR